MFTIGGSTTYGQPFAEEVSFTGWLRTYLPVADSSRTWEVINCGGISYASYRAALVVEEIARYQPDLVVIYSGQNEFLEQPHLWRPAGYSRAGAFDRGFGGPDAALRGCALRDELREGSAAVADDTDELGDQVVTLLDHSVGPTEYTRDDTLRDQVIGHFRFNLARMIDIARSAGAEVVVVTPATNLRDCSPFKSESRSGLSGPERQRFGEALPRPRKPRSRRNGRTL